MVVTFLPYSDINRSIQCLDKQRLNKQKVEAKQILDVIEGRKNYMMNHPATRMWIGYNELLRQYYNTCIDECISRGLSNTMEKMEVGYIEYPWWWNWDKFHYSHQASLMRKHPLFYKNIFPTLDPFYISKGYIWPSKISKESIISTDDSIFFPISKNSNKSSNMSKERLYTIKDLQQICKDRKISGYSRLRKSELMALLQL